MPFSTGFHNADRIPALKAISVVATADFAPRRTQSIYAEHYHGAMVLSVMGANQRGKLIGTAPEADYALIRTEDTNTETRAEEDSWTMGAEYADSIGADLINSSLGYIHWDGDSIGPDYRDLNGRTTFVSQTASMLASKGIVLCNAAGNEGSTQWHKISVPPMRTTYSRSEPWTRTTRSRSSPASVLRKTDVSSPMSAARVSV